MDTAKHYNYNDVHIIDGVSCCAGAVSYSETTVELQTTSVLKTSKTPNGIYIAVIGHDARYHSGYSSGDFQGI